MEPLMEGANRSKDLFKSQHRINDDFSKRNVENHIELRKKNKFDEIFKRRNISINDENEHIFNNKSFSSRKCFDLNAVIDAINKTIDNEQLLSALKSLNQILSSERNPPIEEVIKADVVRILVNILGNAEHPMLQFEAACIVTNITSGTSSQTRHVVESDAVPYFIKLLSSKNSNICEQAIWALGNIAGDGSELRDYVISCGIIDPILSLIGQETPITSLRNIAWTLTNLCRGKNPASSTKTVQQILPALKFIFMSDDTDVLSNSSWALYYMIDGHNENIDAIIKIGVIPRLIKVLDLHHNNEIGILRPALRCLGNIVSGSDEQTQYVIDSNALSIFHSLLNHTKTSVQREATWLLSNISIGNQYQIQSIVDADLVPLIVKKLATSDLKVQKEAAWVITNYTKGANYDQMVYLFKFKVIKHMCELLVSKDIELIKVLLDGLNNILLFSENFEQLEQILLHFEELGGKTNIENLQYHENTHIHRFAFKIVEKYFDDGVFCEEEKYKRNKSTTDNFIFELQNSD